MTVSIEARQDIDDDGAEVLVHSWDGPFDAPDAIAERLPQRSAGLDTRCDPRTPASDPFCRPGPRRASLSRHSAHGHRDLSGTGER
jgi:hypothetical protein